MWATNGVDGSVNASAPATFQLDLNGGTLYTPYIKVADREAAGNAWFNWNGGLTESEGTIGIIHGSKKIPVHLNPKFAAVKSIPQANGAGVTFAPNPTTHSWSVATIVWPVSEEADLCVYDLLGTAVQTEKIRLLGGPEQQRIYFPNLAAGVYVVEIHGLSGIARAKLVIVH